jgi:hypothetical protein
MAKQNGGLVPPIYIETFGQHRRLWYTATNGDAVHRFPTRLTEVWNEYEAIPDEPPNIINDGQTVGLVTLRKNKLLVLVPGTTHKFQYPVNPQELRLVIPATFGQDAPVSGNAGPVLSNNQATGYTPVIQDATGKIHPMQQSVWIVDGENHIVEFPYGVPPMMKPPFRLTYFEYVGATGGGGNGDVHVWHYVHDLTTPELTLCANPAFPGPIPAGPSHFVTGSTGVAIVQSTEGSNTRLMLDVGKGAVRGGRVTGAQWDDASRGIFSAAFGFDTTASGAYAVVGGGDSNSSTGDWSFIGGGQNNIAPGDWSVVSGGWANSAQGNYSAIAGGEDNTSIGDYAFVAGGMGNDAGGLKSWAGGNGSTAGNSGSFVWSDGVSRTSTLDNEVTFGAAGGFRVLDGCLYLLRPNNTGGGIVLDQAPNAPCPPGQGQGSFWVQDLDPTVPMYTDNQGSDFNLLEAAASAVRLVDGGVFVPHQSLVQDGIGPQIATKGLVAGTNIVLTDLGNDISIESVFKGPWIFQDRKAPGVPGGAYPTANVWQRRDLNFQQHTSGGEITLAGNALTFQPGVYHITATAPSICLQGSRIRLQDTVTPATLALGESEWSRSSSALTSAGMSPCRIDSVFTINVQTTAEIQIRGEDTGPSGGGATAALGAPSSTGDVELYTSITIHKIG